MYTAHAEIAGHDIALAECRHFARRVLGLHDRHRLLLRLVDTRQKRLLLDLIVAESLRLGQARMRPAMPVLTANHICELAITMRLASRNTILDFIAQLVTYGMLMRSDCPFDARRKKLELAQPLLSFAADWTRLMMEGWSGSDEMAHAIYREATSRLLQSDRWFQPPLDIARAEDMSGGWMAMQTLFSSLAGGSSEWAHAGQVNICRLATRLGTSRSTLYRLVRASIDAGTMRLAAGEGVETLEINRYHLQQYHRREELRRRVFLDSARMLGPSLVEIRDQTSPLLADRSPDLRTKMEMV